MLLERPSVQRRNVYTSIIPNGDRIGSRLSIFVARGKKKKRTPTIACGLCFVWVCVHLIEGCVFWDSRLCQSFPCWQHVWAYTCACMCACAALTTAWFIPSFSAVAVWGPHYVMPMRRGLYVIETGLWKPPAIWSPAASDVCTSIHQFPLIAQSWDSGPWLIYWVHSP